MEAKKEIIHKFVLSLNRQEMSRLSRCIEYLLHRHGKHQNTGIHKAEIPFEYLHDLKLAINSILDSKE